MDKLGRCINCRKPEWLSERDLCPTCDASWQQLPPDMQQTILERRRSDFNVFQLLKEQMPILFQENQPVKPPVTTPPSQGKSFRFEIIHSGERAAGISPYTNTVHVEIDEPVESEDFIECMKIALREYFDGAKVLTGEELDKIIAAENAAEDRMRDQEQ